jgi:hypothetical protein
VLGWVWGVGTGKKRKVTVIKGVLFQGLKYMQEVVLGERKSVLIREASFQECPY